ncbi:SLATT domain-containing protein [Kocuria salsicia]|uniref:SLATT domain-containing protein n=1 Tax=Kocuria salsicia TaxID=664639 RepID=A0ABV3KA40_9MICC
MSTVACEGCQEELGTLEARIYKTYQCRLKACERLRRRARALNALIVSTSLAGLISGIAMIRDPKIYGSNGDLLWVIISLITFSGSLISASVNYSGRSRDMFLNYRKIQALSVECEVLKKHPQRQSHDEIIRLKTEYDKLLDESENHSPADYLKSRKEEMLKSLSENREEGSSGGMGAQKLNFRQRATLLGSNSLDWAPWLATIFPVALLSRIIQVLV